jgi:hypothetical protein
VFEEVDDDADNTTGPSFSQFYTPTVVGVDRCVQQVFGLRGLNDALYRREDRATYIYNETTEEETWAGPDGDYTSEFDQAIYQLSDPQLSVVATLHDTGYVHWPVADEVEYDPFGSPRRTPIADFNHSGQVSVQDKALRDAGYDTSGMKAIIKSEDMPSGYRAMTLDDGAALGNEAFKSQATLNSALEEELIHQQQAAAGLRRQMMRGSAEALENAADVQRKFPIPK